MLGSEESLLCTGDPEPVTCLGYALLTHLCTSALSKADKASLEGGPGFPVDLRMCHWGGLCMFRGAPELGAHSRVQGG